MIKLTTPILNQDISKLRIGDIINLSGWILTGRDAVLPKLVAVFERGEVENHGIALEGAVIFHTAVSPAGVGPTSSNKKEIEESFIPLARAGVRLFLGKGEISRETIEGLKKYGAIFAVIPPTTALFEDKTKERIVLGWTELGMEALHKIRVENYQAIIAAANGKSIYE